MTSTRNASPQDLPAGVAALRLDGDRGALRFERRLKTTPEDAWSVVSDPERIARWYAPVTVDGAGDGSSWRTFWDDGREYAEGVIVRCEPPRLVEVTWTATDDVDPTESLLRVTLSPEGAGVLLILEHEGLVPADLVQYGAGWHSYLECLPAGDPGLDWGARYRELVPIYVELVRG